MNTANPASPPTSPFTVDGLILAASMLILDANRRNQPRTHPWHAGASTPASPPTWHTASARPHRRPGQRLARPGRLPRTPHGPHQNRQPSQHHACPSEPMNYPVPIEDDDAPLALTQAPKVEETVRA
jgi:hypothetical protein